MPFDVAVRRHRDATGAASAVRIFAEHRRVASAATRAVTPKQRESNPFDPRRFARKLSHSIRKFCSMGQHKKMARISCLQAIEFKAEMARPAGFDPTTPGS
jgi:hypothetical protein